MRALRRLLALGCLAALVAVPASLPALAQAGSATAVTHRQSVLTELSPTGEPGVSRVFTQLTVEGTGSVEVALPEQSTRGLRNLEGFGRPRTDGDTVIWDVEATDDGAFRRSVADSDPDDLPVSIAIAYELDGEPIEPRDLVGESGEVTMTMTLRNLTVEPTELRYFDGFGEPRFETVDVAVPMVGSVAFTLDGRFVDVRAPGGVTAGDGRGNTVVNWSVVLFEPIGAHEVELVYTANVVDAIVPEASVQLLPVDSTSFASLGGAQDSFGDAVGSLRMITTNVLLIDGNLNVLGAGAAQLLDGLVQLRDGAQELAAGLQDTAVPGSRQLADGMGDARAGGGALADGLGELADGAGQLRDGLGDARSGAGQLSAGLGDLAAGAGELSGGLSQARTGATELSGGVGQIADGAGELDDGAQQLAGGLQQVQGGVSDLSAGASQLNDGLAELVAGLEEIAAGTSEGFPAAIQGLPQLAAGAQELGDGVYAGAGSGCAPGSDGCGLLATLQAVSGLLVAVGGAVEATCALEFEEEVALPVCAPESRQSLAGATQAVNGAVSNLSGNQQSVRELVFGAQVLAGQLAPALEELGAAFGSPDSPGPVLDGAQQLSAGAQQLSSGLSFLQQAAVQPLASGAQDLAAGTGQLAAGAGQAADGSGALADGLRQLDDGAGQLAAGAGQAADGSGALVDGLGQLSDGSQRLAAGAGDAAAGASELAAGLGLLDDGANQLADGLGAAGDGAGQLAEGLGDAADGGEQIADGAVQLSEQGMQALAEGVSDGSADTALTLEIANAADQRGRNLEGLPYGTVEGAEASAVFQFDVAGIGVEEGPSGTTRGLVAVVGFVLAGALGLAVRSRFA